MNNTAPVPFKTVENPAEFCGCHWHGFQLAARETALAEKSLRRALSKISEKRLLDSDSSLVVFGSFARHEMLKGSDCDWALLIDGVVNIQHGTQARELAAAIQKVLPAPGAAGAFGNMIFSHELVHVIGGTADSNKNLTIRMLLLLESRPINLSPANASHVWNNIVSNILERYFEEDVHFSPKGKHRVPRFLLNDLTRYWRTICVDYAAKYRQQDGKKWALRNAKMRFSRKLLYAAGLAFCLSCEIDPPNNIHRDLFGLHQDQTAEPFIESALRFASTPPLEYLGRFIEAYIKNPQRRRKIAKKIFGSYNQWLLLMNDPHARTSLENLRHGEVKGNMYFERVRKDSSVFASGLRELFFNRDKDADPIANLSLNYVGF